jgi:hypothetical protein
MTAALRAERLAPKFGRRIRHADGTLFAAEGEHVTLSAFYRRLIADGDLVHTSPPKKARRPKKGT